MGDHNVTEALEKDTSMAKFLNELLYTNCLSENPHSLSSEVKCLRRRYIKLMTTEEVSNKSIQ